MKSNKKVIRKFQLEELEHRYEMAWISRVDVTVPVEGQELEITIPVN